MRSEHGEERANVRRKRRENERGGRASEESKESKEQKRRKQNRVEILTGAGLARLAAARRWWGMVKEAVTRGTRRREGRKEQKKKRKKRGNKKGKVRGGQARVVQKKFFHLSLSLSLSPHSIVKIAALSSLCCFYAMLHFKKAWKQKETESKDQHLLPPPSPPPAPPPN
jgi:hypothetical protein